MNRTALSIAITSLLTLTVSCGEPDTQPPRVVSTIPENESINVDPSLTEISVKFNEEMMDGNWSWAYSDKSEFPQMIGQAYYIENNTRNILPVKLESNKSYVIWINSPKHKNFKDIYGNSAYPFKLTFKTK